MRYLYDKKLLKMCRLDYFKCFFDDFVVGFPNDYYHRFLADGSLVVDEVVDAVSLLDGFTGSPLHGRGVCI